MRKILCITIIIIILTSHCANLYAENSEAENVESDNIEIEENDRTELEKLQTQNEELQQQIEENVEQLGVVEEELSQNLLKIQEIDNQIVESETQLNIINKEIEELDNKIKEIEKQVKEKQKEYDAQKKLTDERLIAICESGKLQYLDVLLGSANIVEFISNYYLISELHESDIELLENTNKQKKEIEENLKQLETQKQESSEKKKTQQRDAQLLANTKTARNIQIAQLTEQVQNIQLKIDEYKTQVASIEAEIKSLAQIAAFGEDYIGETMIWPIPGYTTVTSKFGMRTHPITGLYRLHTGTDVSAPIGADFISMASGVVTKAEYSYSYGNMVIIDHGGGVQTLYAHGSKIMVKLGQLVSQGEAVLKVGSTGYSTGPHAHFEIRINGEPVNPMDYVQP